MHSIYHDSKILKFPYTEHPEIRERAYDFMFRLFSAVVQSPGVEAAKALAVVQNGAWPCDAARELGAYLTRWALNPIGPIPDQWDRCGDPSRVSEYARGLNACLTAIQLKPVRTASNG